MRRVKDSVAGWPLPRCFRPKVSQFWAGFGREIEAAAGLAGLAGQEAPNISKATAPDGSRLSREETFQVQDKAM